MPATQPLLPVVLAIALAGALLPVASTLAQPQLPPQRGKTVSALNALRIQGCDGQPGQGAELEESPRASRAARYLAEGNTLPDALQRAGYRARQARMLHVQGMDLGQPLQPQFPAGACTELLKPGLKELGLYQSRRELWLILALPFSAPANEDCRPGGPAGAGAGEPGARGQPPLREPPVATGTAGEGASATDGGGATACTRHGTQ